MQLPISGDRVKKGNRIGISAACTTTRLPTLCYDFDDLWQLIIRVTFFD